MQGSRLFKIVYFLLEKGRCTAPELAEKLEVSVRTIYRDVDTLSAAGVPVYAARGKGGGIAILPGYALDKALLSGEEKEKILMALQGLAAADGTGAGELLAKLGALFQVKNTSWLEVNLSGWVQNAPGQAVFDQIKTAIFQKVVIEFSYFGSSGRCTRRAVEPLKLIFKSKDWYLYGFCRLRKELRFFKLTRIKELSLCKEHFVREVPAGFSLNAQVKAEKLASVRLKFSPGAAFRVYDEFAGGIAEDGQGNLYVTADLPEGEVLYSYLLSFGAQAEVLAPEAVRQQMKEKLKTMLKLYET